VCKSVPARRVVLKVVLTALLALSLLGGCGYRPVIQRGPLAEANGVNVILFANKSYRPGVEGIPVRQQELPSRRRGNPGA